MSGRGNLSNDGGQSKWNSINQLMREKRIGVLALQETHLDDTAVSSIHNLYGRRIALYHSAPEDRATSAKGVAIALNRELVDTANILTQELVPGRAMALTMHWHRSSKLTILVVYAPNGTAANTQFWQTLLVECNRLPRKPDILLGDFNVVEEAIDRLPPREDPRSAVEALQTTLESLSLRDGWRITEPTEKGYSFPQSGPRSLSRLDRIYVTEDILRTSNDWGIHTTGVPTDHKLVTAHISTAQSPHVGRGRWTLPLQLLEDQVYLDAMIDLGAKTLEEARMSAYGDNRTEQENPQSALATFKKEAIRIARTRMKQKIPKLTAAITKLNLARDELLRRPSISTDETLQTEAGILQERIAELERKRHRYTKTSTTTRYNQNNEAITKYWSRINKDKRPRDIIYALHSPDMAPNVYEQRSDRMAEIARDYHDTVQRQDNAHPTVPVDHQTATRTALASLSVTVSREDRTCLGLEFDEDELRHALRKSPAGKATGLDGLPYEFWKTLSKAKSSRKDDDAPEFNSADLLLLVFNDIAGYGLIPQTTFTNGWLCPLYKKKDRRDIANYRPITLLNTDYKLYTRLLNTRLANVAKYLIHPDQAGFVPGRSISDQTQTCRTLIDFAEATEVNGVIVALDQEKAYDRIRHDYLWKVLQKMGLPDSFISCVRDLYANAHTVVIINGEVSSSFQVTRGVRQGDPLSCLLFDLAIEPLASMLRTSQLTGFTAPGYTGKLITSLFADDTSAFLSEADTWSGLWTILNTWCLASGAKFNRTKTEVIPLGTQEYRTNLITSRAINPDAPLDTVPEDIHIAAEGEPVRVLGAWIGNNADQVAVWTPTLQKIRDFLERWNRCRPSLVGKQRIAQIGPGGITQYLTTVQGMPRSVERSIERIVRPFIWGHDRVPPVAYETLTRHTSEGGIGLLDIKARNEAIDLMWLKRYLTLTEERPAWAYLVDAILNVHVTQDAGQIRPTAQINTFLQDWRPATHSSSPLPGYLKQLLRTAKSYGACFAALKPDRILRTKLPAWYHLDSDSALRRLNNTRVSDCLRDNHGVKYVTDLVRVRHHPDAINVHPGQDADDCQCLTCSAARRAGCANPLRCVNGAAKILNLLPPKWAHDPPPHQDGLSLTPDRIARNATAIEYKRGTVIFNPTLTDRGELSEMFRVFVEPSTLSGSPALRPARGRILQEETVTALILNLAETDLNKARLRDRLSTFGYTWYGEDDPRNCLTTAETEHSTDHASAGEIAAALHVAQATRPDIPINYVCESCDLATTITIDLPRLEDRRWLGTANTALLQALVCELRRRSAATTFRPATSAEEKERMAAAKTMASRALTHTPIHRTHIKMTPKFWLSGVRLANLTQKLAYTGIRSAKKSKMSPSTTRRLRRTATQMEASNLTPVSDKDVWRALRHPDIRRPVADFLWKCMHNAPRVGDYWLHIPGYEERSLCRICGASETMSHILIDCTAIGRAEVWTAANKLWSAKDLPWPRLTMEDILGAGLRRWPNGTVDKRHRRPGADRLWRILITESASLIWKLRCERVIQHDDEDGWQHSARAVRQRWARVLNSRLQIDIQLARKHKGKRGTTKNVVLRTWNRTLEDELALPEDWVGYNRVLVGIDPSFYAPNGVG